ncbi:TBC1 domain family member 15-like isoform X2 [Prunus dulcis]|uniref:TBC1 domain family member 15-like isoform X2 n=1 Tax=Prunus dulcis TaxID=3755 RepID=UPI001481EFEA|nr:TBC1 domain family member 15-like isoform X2 [Prunus dulcis]
MALFFMRKASTAELDAFYPIRAECQVDVPKTRFRLRAGKTLSARRWHAAFSEDGHLDIAKVLRRIQRGGVHPAIKGVVWEFLLGCFDPNSTFDDRNQLRQGRREQYSRLKSECQKMVPVIGSGKFLTTPIITDDGQPIEESANGNTSNNGGDANHATSDKKVIQWKLFLHQIGLDVVRTDRSLVFYESQAHQAKLWDILSVYAWVDNDIGYVQGMNDICSPMVILIDNEADAFWCFERAMRRLRENFRCSASSIGVQSQLSTLSQVIKTIDPKLHQHLEDLDGGEYLFAFRMLMVLFRREFSFVDSLYLWEIGFS